MNSIDVFINKLSKRIEKYEKRLEATHPQVRTMFAEHDAVFENMKSILKLAKRVKNIGVKK